MDPMNLAPEKYSNRVSSITPGTKQLLEGEVLIIMAHNSYQANVMVFSMVIYSISLQETNIGKEICFEKFQGKGNLSLGMTGMYARYK